MKQTIKVSGLDCAGCAAELEEELKSIKGVRFASVAFASQTIVLETDSQETLEIAKKKINGFEEVKIEEEDNSSDREADKEKKKRIREIAELIVAAAFGVISFLLFRFSLEAVAFVLFALSYVVAVYPVFVSTIKNVSKGRIFDENFLMTIASVGALAPGLFFGEGTEGLFESVAVLVLYRLGELLQTMAVGSSRRSVEALMKLKSDSATRLKDGKTEIVAPEELSEGDIVFVKTGERIPVDGSLLSRGATLDMKFLTGEAQPIELTAGDEVISGCVNAGGAFTMSVKRTYERSAVRRIAELVERASAQKAKPEKFITKFARYYTPIVCIAALILAFPVPFIESLVRGGGFGTYFPLRLKSALSFLVISCPCALVISVPLSYFGGIGACARRGILVKGADCLDSLSSVKTVAFDKTGTLTKGDFSVVGVYPHGEIEERELSELVARAEAGSSHPFASAFPSGTKPFEKTENVAGRGIRAFENGTEYLAGSEKLLKEAGVSFEPLQEDDSVVYAAKNGEYVGAIVLADMLKSNAKDALSALRKQGADRLVILTGDTEGRARSVALAVGADEYVSELLPEGKLKKAEEYKKEGTLVYVGDGVNDAPVMAASDVAVSMGKLGSGAAVETSDLVLVSDDLSAIAKGVAVAKKTKRVVSENIAFSIGMKIVLMLFGGFGILPLWLAVFGDVGIMLLAVLNSFRVNKNGADSLALLEKK